jgi:hypothetical protein
MESTGSVHTILATFGFDENKRLKEVFCASFKRDGSMVALANDACILLSRLLQHGDTIEVIVDSLGENRAEGETSGPPSSLIGAIARVAVSVQRDMVVVHLRKD